MTPVTPIGLDKHALDTPYLLVDLDLMEANIARIAGACRAAGVAWRPHTKGQKIPALAHKLIAAGAIGVTCAKLGEAEVMAAAGIQDILIANQIVGAQKIARLVNLRRHADVAVAVDDAGNVAALAEAAAAKGVTLRIVVEIDIGILRSGVTPGAACLALARDVARHPSLRFVGVMGWEGHATTIADPEAKRRVVAEAVAGLTGSAALCREAGLPVEIVSCGGTGTYLQSVAQPGVTEIQAGGGIFGDVRYRTQFGIDHPYALTVMTTVISRPNPKRIVCDAGKKTMSSDAAMPQPIGVGRVTASRVSAEHITLDLAEPAEQPGVGDTLEFVAGYSDTTVHLHDTLYGVRDGKIEIAWPILGRGRTQ
jgi:D-serine deaminase-like pyridoxal phosphate-dependent protein